MVNELCQQDIPLDGDAAGLRYEDVRDIDHPHAHWSALAGGRYPQLFFEDHGYKTIFMEDFGMLFVHAFGPDGHCF